MYTPKIRDRFRAYVLSCLVLSYPVLSYLVLSCTRAGFRGRRGAAAALRPEASRAIRGRRGRLGVEGKERKDRRVGGMLSTRIVGQLNYQDGMMPRGSGWDALG